LGSSFSADGHEEEDNLFDPIAVPGPELKEILNCPSWELRHI